MYNRIIKRLIDIILSFCASVVLLPLILIITAAVRIDSPGPVFFVQKRVGRDGKHFGILKFRTMKTDTPKNMPTHMLKNPEQYITRVGKFLRRASLDEIPQLFNILAGQMAIIGPRPALWNQYDLIEARKQCGADKVRPGLSGWAQVNGRDELCVEDKARLDGEYVKKMSFAFDVKCIFLTIAAVFKGSGFVEGDSARWDIHNGDGEDNKRNQ